MNTLTLCRLNRKHLYSTITFWKQTNKQKMRFIEAEKVKKKSLDCLILYFQVSLVQLHLKLIYITLYAIACHSYTSRKIRVYTARLKIIKRCVCFKNSEVGPALVQTWFAHFTHSPLHSFLMAHQQSPIFYEAKHHIFFFFFFFSP